MLHVVQQINHCNVCSQGLRLLYKKLIERFSICHNHKASSTWKTDKRMLELGTIGLYGHGEWLNCLATEVYNHCPMRPGNNRVFIFFGQRHDKSIA